MPTVILDQRPPPHTRTLVHQPLHPRNHVRLQRLALGDDDHAPLPSQVQQPTAARSQGAGGGGPVVFASQRVGGRYLFLVNQSGRISCIVSSVCVCVCVVKKNGWQV